MTVNDTFLGFLASIFGLSITDSFVYIAVMLSVFLAIWFLMSTFTQQRAGVKFIVALLPHFVADYLESYGTYTISIPFIGNFITDRFVMTLNSLDWIFGMGIFRSVGLPILQTYTENAPSYDNIIATTIIWGYSIGDSILQVLIFGMAIYSIITLLENKFNFQMPWQKVSSIAIGFVMVALYAYAFSNPIEEKAKATEYINGFMNFLSASTGGEKLYVAVSLAASLFIMYYIVLMVTQFFISATIVVKPHKKSMDFDTSFESMSFLTVLFYTFIYMMHPDYKWYFIFMVVIIWNAFKRFLDTVVSDVRFKNNERDRMNMQSRLIKKELFSEIGQPRGLSSNNMTGQKSGISKGFIALIILGAIAVIAGIFFM